jgi:hypothetical protein
MTQLNHIYHTEENNDHFVCETIEKEKETCQKEEIFLVVFKLFFT